MKPRLGLGAAVVGVSLLATHAFAQPVMGAHRAERIRMACRDARSGDAEHYVLAAGMAAVGGGLLLPSAFSDPTTRAPFASFEEGLGAGLVVSGAILALRPVVGGGLRVLETCERIAHRDFENVVVLRDAERYFNALALSQRTYDLAVSAAAVGVIALGTALSFALSSDPHNQWYWSGMIFGVPAAFMLDLILPPPPVRASIRFHRGGYETPRDVPPLSVRWTGTGLVGAF